MLHYDFLNMSYAFSGKALYDLISCCNGESVTTMKYMFYKARAFNQPLDDWNVASVTDMAAMFDGASNFNQSLDDWNVKKKQEKQICVN